MSEGFTVGIYKIMKVVGTRAFKLFFEDFYIIDLPAFISWQGALQILARPHMAFLKFSFLSAL